MKKFTAKALLAIMLILPIFTVGTAEAATTWNVTGNYDVALNYLGSDYVYDVNFNQSSTTGALTGNGAYPATGTPVYTWVIDSGMVTDSQLTFTAHYTAPSEATTTVMNATGTIAMNGSITGVWSDNYGGMTRTGTWTTVSGMATSTATTTATTTSSLAAEDFGVVNYDTGLGWLKGYSAGFGLTGATFDDATSVVVKLYGAGDQLLQTNTLIGDVSGTQISSPFDVSGNFDYATDGYWTNVRNTQYGQSVPAVKVVATVTLENGTVLTATNTNLSGDPATIYPVVTPPAPTPTNKDMCKNGGWMNFTNPSFKNQGQCVSYTNKR